MEEVEFKKNPDAEMEADDGNDTGEASESRTPRWPTGIRDSLNFTDLKGSFNAKSWTKVLLGMEGKRGRDDEIARLAALELGETNLKGRPRNPHRALELCGVIKPEGGVTRLAKLGRILHDLADENGLRRHVAREALAFLCRFQSDNPVNRKEWPPGCRVHPYWMVLRAACLLDFKLHWDEVNREIMRVMSDEDIDSVVTRIAKARREPGYAEWIGSPVDDEGYLAARTWPAGSHAPQNKSPVSQLKDQRFTPFLKLAGFGELLLESPGNTGDGWWTVPEDVRNIVERTVAVQPQHIDLAGKDEWIEWLYEGNVVTKFDVEEICPPAEEPIGEVTPIHELTLGKLKAAIATYAPDLRYSDHLLASIVASVRSGDGKNFIILRGISGTGKSKLVSALASAVYQIANPVRPFFHQIEVRPDWTDVSNVLGYADPVKGEYVRPRFMQALEAANAEYRLRGKNAYPIFVCLDEMNLAPIEHYLADCLSAMESGFDIDHGILENGVLKTISWPPNLFMFGTINVDETTAEISDKVLDRAQVIDTSDIEIEGPLTEWLEATAHLSAGDKTLIASTLIAVWKSLRDVHRHFGFRTTKAMVRFIDEAVASSDGILDAVSALDVQLAQKVLVKLRGEGDQWSATLNSMKATISKLEGNSRSIKIIERMISDHGKLGSFQFWE
jgi:MoxR-like ATPase